MQYTLLFNTRGRKKHRYTDFYNPGNKIKLNVPNFLNIKPLPKHPNKNLSYPKAKKMYGMSLSPLGDWDKDKVINMLDCRPFDPLRHKIPEEHKRKRIFSYASGYITIGKAWDKILEDIPHLNWNKRVEEEYSKAFLHSALERKKIKKKMGESPFKDVVGTYHIKHVSLDNSQQLVVQHYLLKYLKEKHPDKKFIFRSDSPSKADVVDLKTGQLYENRKVSTYFDKSTPPYIRNLLSLLRPDTSITIVITDNPIDLAKKSAYISDKIKEECKRGKTYSIDDFVSTCETVAREALGATVYEARTGPFSDIRSWNAIAWFFKGNDTSGVPLGRVMLRWGTTNGKWTGRKDIGIAYYPGEEYMGEYSFYHRRLTRGGLGWDPSYHARGFYGPLSADMGRALVGELQKILRSKGYYTHIIHTPYNYHGYDDLRRSFTTRMEDMVEAMKSGGSKLHMGPIPIQKPVKVGYGKAISKILTSEKIPKPLMHSLALHGDEHEVAALAKRKDLPEDVKREILSRATPRVIDAILDNSAFEIDENTIINRLISTGDIYALAKLLIRNISNTGKSKVFKKIIDVLPETDISDAPSSFKNNVLKYVYKTLTSPNNPVRKLLINRQSENDMFILRNMVSNNDHFNLTKNEIDKLLQNPYSPFVILVIEKVKLTPEQFHKLSRHPSADVRIKMAKLKRLPDDDMLALVKDDNSAVYGRILARKTIGPKTMKYILSQYDPSERGFKDRFINILKTKDLSDEELQLVLRRPDIDVEMLNALIQNPNMTENQRLKILKKFIDTEEVSSDFIRTFITYPDVYNYIIKAIKTKPILRTIIADTDDINLKHDAKSKLFATINKYADAVQKRLLLRNPDVDDELKNIIKMELKSMTHKYY